MTWLDTTIKSKEELDKLFKDKASSLVSDKYFEFEKKWVPIEKKIKEFINSYREKNILHGTADDGGDWDDGTLDYEIPVYDKEDD